MSKKEVLMGNHATSYGVKLARTEVISAYPITPQTQIVEELSEMCAKGELNAKFIKVESEHSAMAATIAASQAGARAFTATSSQGLALMHELLFWAAYGRLPVVLCNVNRAMAPGWSIWSDQTDSLAQRDTGWIQLYCETNQEVIDTILMAFRLAETIYLPVMVVYDSFILSHTYEPVEIPDISEVDKFLPPFKPKYKLDTSAPMTFNPLCAPDNYMEFRYIMEKAHREAINTYNDIAKNFEKKFGRPNDIVEMIDADDAEIVFLTSGSMTSTARVAVKQLRERGEKVGICKIRMFRPFPFDALREAAGNISGGRKIKKIAVLDRNISHGCGGIWSSEIKSAFYDIAQAPDIFTFHIGLGGRDVTPESIIEVYNKTKAADHPSEDIWIGLKK
ncbi:MAG TPA: pyruvate ferredoxin oxidoreductase [bacterium]|nr:pyruvate ferredoxin oxidoreductase [Myxococcales bacterium]OQA61146.1 MAG: Pyruvate synthase subunit PorA [bacterium ADurb.Bin270]HPW44841.1 pyruvate ferredoxin oxidoreductase [bacterium]HQC50515.1 pyruvate ferredoxin oxidoreductase [bacterium]HQH79818.1 pyruvate ferredoxin oxidoreductase [bacterium]